MAPVLQLVTVPVVNTYTCSKIYDFGITQRMFCAGYMDGTLKDICSGDSGGPVVKDGIQYGVVSWGKACADPRYPNVYSKVSYERIWIKEVSGVWVDAFFIIIKLFEL